MQLSTKTLTLLKNFATLEGSLLIKAGNELRQKAKGGAVLAEACVDERFPTEIAIGDLPNFLAVAALLKRPDFEFQADRVRITEKDGEARVDYIYAPPSLIDTKPPKKVPTLPTGLIEFDLSEEKWISLQKAATVLNKGDMRIVSDGTDVSIAAFNLRNPSGHSFSIRVGAKAHGLQCDVTLSMSNLKLLKGAYKCTVAPAFVVFDCISGYDLRYYVASNFKSTLGKTAV